VERERAFHNSPVADGSPTNAAREWWQSPGDLVRFSRRIELLQTELKRHNIPRVLVIGCGNGEWVNEISRLANVVGVDMSDQVIDRATSALRERGCLVAGEPNRSNPLVRMMYSSPKLRVKYGLTPDEQAFTRTTVIRQLRKSFADIDVTHFDFWHPALGSDNASSFRCRFALALESIPIISSISGSLWIVAKRQS
jgi:SAM-dependent methyltransferase